MTEMLENVARRRPLMRHEVESRGPLFVAIYAAAYADAMARHAHGAQTRRFEKLPDGSLNAVITVVDGHDDASEWARTCAERCCR